MKTYFHVCFSLAVVLCVTSLTAAQEMPEMPNPQKEHEWLQKFVGEWESVGKGKMAEDGPTMECRGTAKSRMLGGFWMVSEGKGDMGMPMETLMTLGYDTKKGKYVGTWIDSMMNHMWHYEGTLEGDKLTLNAKGPDMMSTEKGKLINYRDVFEFKSADHYTITSLAEGEDGQWQTFMTAEVTRKK